MLNADISTDAIFFITQAKSLYENVAVEFKKIDQQGLRAQTDVSALAHICGQLVPYTSVKTEMIELYPSLPYHVWRASNYFLFPLYPY